LKLPVISGKEALKALERAGFVVMQRGSHVRIKKVTSESVIKITIPIHETLDRGTLKGILRNAHLTAEEFVDLL
jgi:predicted RNA binding protein YcfA (HicA-like mRNA interferase family)